MIHDRITRRLASFGVEDPFGKGDYLVVDDNEGFRWNTIEVHSLAMLAPAVVKAVQEELAGIDDWEIVVAVDVPGTESLWPPMGLTIRSDEIVDDLRREHFPEPYRSLAYSGARPDSDRH